MNEYILWWNRRSLFGLLGPGRGGSPFRPGWRVGRPLSIIAPTLLRIAEHIIRFVDSLGSSGVWLYSRIRMVAAHQRAIPELDEPVLGCSGNPKGGVKVFLTHRYSVGAFSILSCPRTSDISFRFRAGHRASALRDIRGGSQSYASRKARRHEWLTSASWRKLSLTTGRSS